LVQIALPSFFLCELFIPEDGKEYFSEIFVNLSSRIIILITVALFRASYSMI
jgi:hypothetical protein